MIKQVIVDFDGTVVRHENPMVGADVPDAVRVLHRLQDAGHILILVTMRVDGLLEDAKKWFVDRKINITYFNRNEMYETGSRKIYSHLIIDDHCCGIPLVLHPNDPARKPFVNWSEVEKILEERGYL
jgi:hydroxymethylpyrimidine pyrophosphatase-like HAD family hydrolase